MGPLPEAFISAVASARQDLTPDAFHNIEVSDEYHDLMKRYAEYTELTLSGQHGSTARFWMLYIKLVQIFMQFSRAYRTNDLELFVYTLGEMCPIFFAGNRPNYARWMVRYYHNLMNMDSTHPGVRNMLEQGALSVRRTNKTFSRTQVDITLEQTVNADAASRLTGITAFNPSDSARQKWMITRAVRSRIVGSLLAKAGLKSHEDVSKALKPYRVTRDNNDLWKLIDAIKNTMNPFNQCMDDNLYCITTGASVAHNIKEDLLGFQEKGQQLLANFTSESFLDQGRFEKPITRRKIRNFATAAVKKSITAKDQKVIELQGTRDLFGRLLYISTMEQIDIEKVFKYPLTPVPLALAHVDGSINKTDKAKLLHKLEGMVEHDKPSAIDVTLVDAMFLLHALVNLPASFGEIAELILRRLCDMAPRTDFVCDTYVTPTIKEAERNRRGAQEITFAVTGAEQKRPQNWQTALQSSSFKTAFLRFLAAEWQKQRYAIILKDHTIFMGLDNICYSYKEEDGRVIRENAETLYCHHEEADTRLVYHLDKITQASPSLNVSVRSNDTDVLVLLLCYASSVHDCPNVWMDVGLSSNNSRRYISIPSLVHHLGPNVLQALPGLHAFTGTDFTSSFMSKGKQRPLEIMMKHDEFITSFAELGKHKNVPDDVFHTIEHFVCSLYGKPNLHSVDTARYALFQHTYAPKKQGDPLDRIKGVHASSMPPCRPVLVNKIKRANYVASLWKHAVQADPGNASGQPNEHGWHVVDGNYNINWFDGEQMPHSITQILGEQGTADTIDDDDEAAVGAQFFGSDEESDVDDEDENDWS